MAPAFTHLPLPAGTAAARVAGLADALEARALALSPLLAQFDAHLVAVAPALSRTEPEHLLELLELGLRFRAQPAAARRARPAGTGVDELVRLASRLAAQGCPGPELARVRAWRDFAVAANVRDVLAVADAACAWFEQAAARLGPDLSGAGDALQLLRAEILGRALRRRPQVFAGSGGGPLTGSPGARPAAACCGADPAQRSGSTARRGPGPADPSPAGASSPVRSGW